VSPLCSLDNLALSVEAFAAPYQKNTMVVAACRLPPGAASEVRLANDYEFISKGGQIRAALMLNDREHPRKP